MLETKKVPSRHHPALGPAPLRPTRVPRTPRVPPGLCPHGDGGAGVFLPSFFPSFFPSTLLSFHLSFLPSFLLSILPSPERCSAWPLLKPRRWGTRRASKTEKNTFRGKVGNITQIFQRGLLFRNQPRLPPFKRQRQIPENRLSGKVKVERPPRAGILKQPVKCPMPSVS